MYVLTVSREKLTVTLAEGEDRARLTKHVGRTPDATCPHPVDSYEAVGWLCETVGVWPAEALNA